LSGLGLSKTPVLLCDDRTYSTWTIKQLKCQPTAGSGSRSPALGEGFA
jgi:hypothetical protein